MDNLKKSFKSLKWYEWIMIAIMVVIAGYTMINSFLNPSSSLNPSWLTVINFISAICGIICIFFCAKASISNYIFGIVNTIVYIIYLAYWKIYGTMCLELLVYLPVNIISWGLWAKHRDEKEPEKTKSKRLYIYQNLICVVIVCISAFLYHLILEKVGGNVVWLDAFTVSIGLVATFLQMLRYREQYAWWNITNVVAIAMYIQHFDPVYLTKKSIYMIMSIIGFINWWKLNKERNMKNE